MARLLALFCISISWLMVKSVHAQSVTIELDVFGLNQNQFAARQTLQYACASITLSNTPSSAAADLLNTCNTINPLDDEDPALSEALSRLLPEEAFAISDALTDASDLQVTNISARLNTLREQQNAGLTLRDSLLAINGGAAASPRLRNLEMFLSGQVSSGEVDGKQLQQDADLAGSQITFGADYRLSNQFIVGAGIGVFQHDTQFSNTAGGSEISGINATLFATYAKNSLGYLDVVLDIGRNDFDFSRQINVVDGNRVLATSSTDSSSLSLTIGLGRSFQFSAYEFAPYVRAGLKSASVDGYSEQADSEQPGFGSTLRVASQSINSTTISLGASIARVISTSRFVLVPQLNIEAEIEADSEKDPLSAYFIADPDQQAFDVQGEIRDESYVNLGLGTTAVFARGKNAFVFYETRLAHDSITQHWLKFGLRLEF